MWNFSLVFNHWQFGISISQLDTKIYWWWKSAKLPSNFIDSFLTSIACSCSWLRFNWNKTTSSQTSQTNDYHPVLFYYTSRILFQISYIFVGLHGLSLFWPHQQKLAELLSWRKIEFPLGGKSTMIIHSSNSIYTPFKEVCPVKWWPYVICVSIEWD